MSSRVRIPHALALALALLLLPAALAHANPAYDRVSAAYAQGGGRIDGCAFTEAELKDALAGIPRAIARYVPDLRKAIKAGIATHASGGCKGRTPGGAAAPPAGTPTTPTTTPSTTPAPGVTTTTTPAPAPAPATTPAPAAPGAANGSTVPTVPQPSAAPARHRDRTPLLVALAVLGALLVAALALWGWARLRGWDPTWAARARHAWGEAGYRTTATWSEFTDWLRLGR